MIYNEKNVLGTRTRLELTKLASDMIGSDSVSFGKGNENKYKEEIIIKILNGKESLDFDTRVAFCQSVYHQLSYIMLIFAELYQRGLFKNDEYIEKVKELVREKWHYEFRPGTEKEDLYNIEKCEQSFIHNIVNSFYADFGEIKKIFSKFFKGEKDYEISVNRLKEVISDTGINLADIQRIDWEHNEDLSEMEKLEQILFELADDILERFFKYRDKKTEEEAEEEAARILENFKIEKNKSVFRLSAKSYHLFARRIVRELKKVCGFGKKTEEKLKKALDSYEKEISTVWLREKLFGKVYFDWVEKLFDIGRDSGKNESLRASWELRTTVLLLKKYSRDSLAIFRDDVELYMRAVLEYYGRLPFYRRERIAFCEKYDNVCSIRQKICDDDKPHIYLSQYGKNQKEQFLFVNPIVAVERRNDLNYVVGFDLAKSKVESMKLRRLIVLDEPGMSGKMFSKEISKDGRSVIGTNKQVEKVIRAALVDMDVADVGNAEQVKRWLITNINEEVKEQFEDNHALRPTVILTKSKEIIGLQPMKNNKGRYFVKVRGIEKDIRRYFKHICDMAECDYGELQITELEKN